MVSRFMDLERKSILVQFIAVEPLAFHSTADGTDLVQDILRKQLARSDADIFGQEGTLSTDDQGEFLVFEPADTKNRSLHLPVEHLAYCGALRRMVYDANDRRDPDQIHRREFENVDLANRYAQYIVGPPIFVAVFHGFDNALSYTFVTQSADDACLIVMKLMRAFKMHEQRGQGQNNQGYPSFHEGVRPSSPLGIRQASPLNQSIQPFSIDHRTASSSPVPRHRSNSYIQDPRHDELIQRLLNHPNLEVISRGFDDIPIMSAPTSMNQRNSPIMLNNSASSSSAFPMMGRSTPQSMRPPSPPILGLSDANHSQNVPLGNPNPKVIYKPNNQEVVYKQNIMVRWLQPPTPPPPAPIIIREVQAPQPIQPPLVCRQIPACPPTPPPIIVREKPPPCPPCGQPLIIEKRIPCAPLPRQVIVERYPPPASKPPTIIYEKYLPTAPAPRPIIVKREICQPVGCPVVQQQIPCRQIIRQVTQVQPAPQPALVCFPQQKQQQQQQQAVQQLVPVFATRQHVVQPKGVRVVRQVIGPTPPSAQIYSSANPSLIQAMPTTLIQ